MGVFDAKNFFEKHRLQCIEKKQIFKSEIHDILVGKSSLLLKFTIKGRDKTLVEMEANLKSVIIKLKKKILINNYNQDNRRN